jgi:hypothetical protein
VTARSPAPDEPVPYWPAYLPAAQPDTSARYWPTRAAETEAEADFEAGS